MQDYRSWKFTKRKWKKVYKYCQVGLKLLYSEQNKSDGKELTKKERKKLEKAERKKQRREAKEEKKKKEAEIEEAIRKEDERIKVSSRRFHFNCPARQSFLPDFLAS